MCGLLLGRRKNKEEEERWRKFWFFSEALSLLTCLERGSWNMVSSGELKKEVRVFQFHPLQHSLALNPKGWSLAQIRSLLCATPCSWMLTLEAEIFCLSSVLPAGATGHADL